MYQEAAGLENSAQHGAQVHLNANAASKDRYPP
jgi:hypothetical protein